MTLPLCVEESDVGRPSEPLVRGNVSIEDVRIEAIGSALTGRNRPSGAKGLGSSRYGQAWQASSHHGHLGRCASVLSLGGETAAN